MTGMGLQGYEGWIGRQVVDQAGDKIGKVSQIYVDDETGRPEWLAVNTGMFKSKSSFVPIGSGQLRGDDVVVSFDKGKVKDAPRVEDDKDGYLTPEEEQDLYRYYGSGYSTATGRSADDKAEMGRDTSGPNTDDAMTRSEEQLEVGTQKRERGRARLRKYVVTEQVTQTVPVSHEEVRVEREPVTESNRAAATSGPEISEEEHEIVLHEERPVVQKEVVPVERVRLAKDTVTGEEKISDEVRKEVIETEGDDRPPR